MGCRYPSHSFVLGPRREEARAVPTTLPRRQDEEERALETRNRRTARWLVAGIVFLIVVSIIVIWTRN